MGDIEVHFTHQSMYVSPEGLRCVQCGIEQPWNSRLLSQLRRPCVLYFEHHARLLPLTLYLSLDPAVSQDLLDSPGTLRPSVGSILVSTDETILTRATPQSGEGG